MLEALAPVLAAPVLAQLFLRHGDGRGLMGLEPRPLLASAAAALVSELTGHVLALAGYVQQAALPVVARLTMNVSFHLNGAR